MSPEEDRTRDAVDSETKHYQLSYSGPFVRFNSLVFNSSAVFNCKFLPDVAVYVLAQSPVVGGVGIFSLSNLTGVQLTGLTDHSISSPVLMTWCDLEL